jgi:hypothetical protein
MAASSIGVQQISPQTGTGWQNPNPAPWLPNDPDSEDSSKQDRAPASPGTGQVVDRVA